MNRITALFERKERDLLSLYFVAGYPRLNDTLSIIKAIEQRGVDMVEVGVPFSDPMADGPSIQKASEEALANGMSLKLLFEQLRDLRKEVTIPVLLMSYLNPIYQYGFDAFFEQCVEVGVDGVIIPDLPFEEYVRSYEEKAKRYGIKVIMLITPETADERIRAIDRHASGFIYMVSSASTTGAQRSFDREKCAYFQRVEAMTLRHHCMVGFGISNRETFDAAKRYASGAIVGSRFVDHLGRAERVEEAVDRLLSDLEQ